MSISRGVQTVHPGFLSKVGGLSVHSGGMGPEAPGQPDDVDTGLKPR